MEIAAKQTVYVWKYGTTWCRWVLHSFVYSDFHQQWCPWWEVTTVLPAIGVLETLAQQVGKFHHHWFGDVCVSQSLHGNPSWNRRYKSLGSMFCGRRATTCVIALHYREAKVFELIAAWKLCNEDCEDICVWVMTKSPFWMLEEQMRRIWNFSNAIGDPMAQLVWRCQRWQTAGGGSNPCRCGAPTTVWLWQSAEGSPSEGRSWYHQFTFPATDRVAWWNQEDQMGISSEGCGYPHDAWNW